MPTIRCQTRQFPDIQAVIWDKDGTLADSRDYLRRLGQARSRLIDAQVPGVQEPLLMAFGLDGVTLHPAGLLAVGTRAENQVAAAAYIAETGQTWSTAMAIAQSAFAEAEASLPRKASLTPLFPAVSQIIAQLAQAGVVQAIASADSTAQVEDFVAYYELSAPIAAAVGIDGLPGKPDPAVYYRICDRLGLAPAQTLYIGDTQIDAEMCQAAGAGGFIAATWGWDEDQAVDAAAYLDSADHLAIESSL